MFSGLFVFPRSLKPVWGSSLVSQSHQARTLLSTHTPILSDHSPASSKPHAPPAPSLSSSHLFPVATTAIMVLQEKRKAADQLTVTDERTGKTYSIPYAFPDRTILARELANLSTRCHRPVGVALFLPWGYDLASLTMPSQQRRSGR